MKDVVRINSGDSANIDVSIRLEQMMREIQIKLDREIFAKQTTIERHEMEILRLQGEVELKNKIIQESINKLRECEKTFEGNRQLINRLLNDIEKMNQDIEWYKKTYEKRSLLGTIRQKLFSK